MNGVAPDPGLRPGRGARLPLCRWILDAANARGRPRRPRRWRRIASTSMPRACYRFTWNTFCDWFLEFAKPVLNGPDGAAKDEVRATAAHVLGMILRLLHPAMPFVTEELWDQFGYGAGVQPDPRALAGSRSRCTAPEAARAELDWVVRLIGEVRAVRAEMNVPPSALAPILLRDARAGDAGAGASAGRRRSAAWRGATEVGPLQGEVPPGSAQAVLDEATVVLPLAGLIDLAAERARLERSARKALGEAEKVARKLDNADFVRRAQAGGGGGEPRAPGRLRAGGGAAGRRDRPDHRAGGVIVNVPLPLAGEGLGEGGTPPPQRMPPSPDPLPPAGEGFGADTC